MILNSYINQLEFYHNQLDDTLTQMAKLASQSSLFKLVHSLPGIQVNLTSRFIAELGDISRFNNYKALICLCRY
jgi:hypothetical protein